MKIRGNLILILQEMIGIIIPPGEIKKMVEKAAAHVAKNGSEFEKALIEMEQHKPQFSFLLKENPYRAYYDHMVAEYSRKLLAQNQEQQEPKMEAKKEVENSQQAEYLERVFEQVKQPDPDRFSAEVPQKITKLQIAMILHTAQYAAINGKNFLIALSERQKNNPQFQFLRTSSDNHQFFKKLIEAYKAVEAFGSEEMAQLQKYVNDKQTILNKCREVYEYHRLRQEQNKGKKGDVENKKEKNIDWNDFELVQTIVFDDFKSKNSYRDEFKIQPSLYNKNMEQKIISEPKKKQLLQQCHVCKKHILASELTKHLKGCLGNTNSKSKPNPSEISMGEAVDITKNLQNLSQRRPDIFGGQGQKIKLDEVQQAQKDNEEKLIWDGQGSNINRSTAKAVMLKNQQKKLHDAMRQSK